MRESKRSLGVQYCGSGNKVTTATTSTVLVYNSKHEQRDSKLARQQNNKTTRQQNSTTAGQRDSGINITIAQHKANKR